MSISALLNPLLNAGGTCPGSRRLLPPTQLPLDFWLSLIEGRILRLLDPHVPLAADAVFAGLRHGRLGGPKTYRCALVALYLRGLVRHTCLGWTATARGKQADVELILTVNKLQKNGLTPADVDQQT